MPPPTILAISVYLATLVGILTLIRLNRHIDTVAKGAGRAGEAFVQERRVYNAKQAGWVFENKEQRMPYERNSELPDQVRDNASSACQTVFRRAFNSIEEENPDRGESEIFSRAWGAMQNACSKGNGDTWTKDSIQNMQLVTNTIEPESVERQELNGREYLTAPVTLMRAMRLDQGYVPQEEIEKAASAWNGTPTTLNHPVNEHGAPISANAPGVAESTWTGRVFNAESNNGGERLDGEVWVDVAQTQELGTNGDTILNRFEDGEPLEVSTGYFFDELPAGRYDGEFRDRVAGNLRPDHLALLPNSEGRCSVADGCGFNPGSGIQAANVDALNDSSLALATNSADTDEPADDEAAESAVGSLEHETMDDTDKIDDLVTNHGLDRDTMDELAGTDCLDQIHQRFTTNESDGDKEIESDGGDTDVETVSERETETDDENVVAVDLGDHESLGDLIEAEVAEAVAANETETKRQALVEEITTNSDNYDADDLSDTPVGVLETLRDDVVTPSVSANFAGRPSLGEARGDEDNASFPSLAANKRAAELDGGD